MNRIYRTCWRWTIGWFYKDYRKYIFAKPFNFTKMICRIRQHPCGVWFYTLSQDEPDMQCKNCEDDLG